MALIQSDEAVLRGFVHATDATLNNDNHTTPPENKVLGGAGLTKIRFLERPTLRKKDSWRGLPYKKNLGEAGPAK